MRGYHSPAPSRYINLSIIERRLRVRSVLIERDRWRIVERPQRPEILSVEFSPGSAVEARPVADPLVRHRASQALVPAAEQLAHQSDLFTERPFRSVNETLSY